MVEDLNLLMISLCRQYWGNISTIFSRISEASTSNFLESLRNVHSLLVGDSGSRINWCIIMIGDSLYKF